MVKKKSEKLKTQNKKNQTIHVEGDVRDANVIIGDKNTIDNSIKTTNIFNNTKPKNLILYGFFVAFLIGVVAWVFYYNFFRYDRAIASGQLNVFIVPFVEEKSWGYMNTDLGWNIAQIFTDNVKEEFENAGLETDINILGPANKIPKSYAFTETQLINSIEDISKNINGQIIVYGIISEDEYGDSIVNVKIYISPTNFGEAQELISDSLMGELSLGSFRLISNTISGGDILAQNKELRDRLVIFSSLINFLGAYLGEDFNSAQKYIENASDLSLWNNTSGLEVIYLINGNMEIRRARIFMVEKDLINTLKSIEQAEFYFNEAMRTSIRNGNGDYARAYLGLAGAENLLAIAEANIESDVSLINTNALNQTLVYLDKAQISENQPETADILVKVNYSKAQVALAYYAKTSESNYLDTATEHYQQVIEEYDRTNTERIVDFVALSYSGLGHIATQKGETSIAIENFLSAQNISSNPSLKVQCILNVADIYFFRKEYDLALKYYQDLLDRRLDLEKAVSSEKIKEIEERIKFIKGDTL